MTAWKKVLPFTTAQARNQLGTLGGVRSRPRGAQIFLTLSNSFKLCATYISRGAKIFQGGLAPLSYRPTTTYQCGTDFSSLVKIKSN